MGIPYGRRVIFVEPLDLFRLSEYNYSGFLYCDLRISGCLSEFSKFVNQTSSKDLLTIALFKAVYYYHTRYFPQSEDNTLVSIIADINLKLRNTGKLVKSDLMKQIEEKRPTAKDISPI